jgi:chemotaxis protein CheX
MQAKYINPFIHATVGLFRDFIGVNVQPAKPHIREDPQNLEEVSGIIGLAGETVGAVVLSLSRDMAIGVISQMEGKPYQALTNDVIDGVGELVNVIAGNAKKDLKDFRIDISLPGVVTGQSYQIHWPEGIPVIAVPFESDMGSFSVNVSLRDMQ